MEWAHGVVEAFVIINFLSFTLLSTRIFSLDHAGTSSYVFFVSFLAGTGTTVWYMCHNVTPNLFVLLAGGVAAALSCLLFVSAARVIRSKPLTAIFSPDEPRFLHQSGPYKFMRHPFYVAYVLNFMAAYLSSATVATFVLMLAAAAVYGYAAHLEEKKFAKSPLAAEYEAYRKSTGLFQSGAQTRDK